jgi:hypothetical protein
MLCGKDGKTIMETYKMIKSLFGPTRMLENWRTVPLQKEQNLKWTQSTPSYQHHHTLKKWADSIGTKNYYLFYLDVMECWGEGVC